MQVVWRALPTDRVTVGVGGRRETADVGPPVRLHHRAGWSRRVDPLPGGPGSLLVAGLQPATTYPVWVEGPGLPRTDLGAVRTLPRPPGALLSRFTTISDLHIGERKFGLLGDIVEGPDPGRPAEAYPQRCTRAAIEEARCWGSELMVVKGDLTDKSRPWEVEAAHDLLAGSGLDCVAQLGNHDVGRWIDVTTELPDVPTADPGRIVVRDLPGVRVVLGHSPIFRDRPGDLDATAVARLGEVVAGAGPAVVCLHHPPQRHQVPLSYPPGLVRTASRALTATLRAANPATVVLAGHTHRNRRYTVDGITVAEVGSTKDYPGVWAGYAVHEGGIRQVVHRTARPDVIRWTEATARAMGGQWGRWSPGRLDDRCWSMGWPAG